MTFRRHILTAVSFLGLLVCAVYATAHILDGRWLYALPFAAATGVLATLTPLLTKEATK